ncbi:Synaptobrevin like protein ykt6 [Dictyocoela muelleri]|nr:Synaptobrevin like protein ykt6 [Dictyocoela muelleri]
MLISLISIDKETSKIDKESYDLSQFSIFTKNQVKSFLQFICIEIAKEMKQNNKGSLIDSNTSTDILKYSSNSEIDKTTSKNDNSAISKTNKTTSKFYNSSSSKIQEISQQHGNKLYRIIVKSTEHNLFMLSCDDKDYPLSIINEVLCKAAYTDEKYSYLLSNYQDWKKHDLVTLVKKELDETKQIMSKTLKDVIERGERIEKLEQQSEELKINTERLFKKAKAQNKCCRLF